MAKAQNIADTIKWKKKRKRHLGDKCNNAKCGICARHKSLGNSSKLDRKQEKTAKEKGKHDQMDL